MSGVPDDQTSRAGFVGQAIVVRRLSQLSRIALDTLEKSDRVEARVDRRQGQATKNDGMSHGSDLLL